MVQIKDLYAGKPDAKDEVTTEGFAPFLESYIAPPNFDFDALLNGTHYFITGYKGTGKTALQFYLDDLLRKDDPSTCSSFVFFKEDYSENQRQELEELSKRQLSSVSITDDVVLDGQDFEYIWRWLFYQRIIEDNSVYNGGLFIDNEEWTAFCKSISCISISKKRKLFIPPKLKFALPVADPSTQATISPEFELDFSTFKSTNSDAYRAFTSTIDEADKLFFQVKRTDTPYYIFVDELEAYYGDEKVFLRDLRLIRDLIFTTKKLNGIFANFQSKTKIICSVRTEILNAINRFIVTKELNKVTSGFEVPLVWDYTNTNSFSHPIIKILLKRIEMAEKAQGNELSEKDIIQKWFPEKIRGTAPVNYILNNNWSKPRDIVRFISSAKSCLCSTNNSFSQATCEMCHKKYSVDSLTEIKEEMRALYSPQDIDSIITCLTGFRAVFSYSELEERVNTYFSQSIWAGKTLPILRDLYRLGFVGNYSKISHSHRWQHHGDDGLIVSNDWQIMIHKALQSAISVSSRHDRGIARRAEIDFPGKIIEAEVVRIVPNYAILQFTVNQKNYIGSIHISKLSPQRVSRVEEQVRLGEVVHAKILKYDSNHSKWQLTLVF